MCHQKPRGGGTNIRDVICVPRPKSIGFVVGQAVGNPVCLAGVGPICVFLCVQVSTVIILAKLLSISISISIVESHELILTN